MTENMTRRQQVERAYRHAWFPVARSVDIAEPQEATLVGVRLVVYRDADGKAVVQSARCPHRGANLAQGTVKNGEIECPYHGWRFGSDGQCTAVPSLGSRGRIPPRAQVKVYPAVEKFGHVWTVLDKPAHNLYEAPPELRELDVEALTAPPMPAKAGVAAIMENFRDVAHFPFVHHRSMGSFPADVRPLVVHREGLKVGMFQTVPKMEAYHSVNGSTFWQYCCQAPAFFMILMDHGDVGKRAFIIFPAPVSYDEIVLWHWVANERDFKGTSLEETLQMELDVSEEDIGIVESLQPAEIPWDNEETEVSVPADKFTLAYRKAFWKFVARANEFYEPLGENSSLSEYADRDAESFTDEDVAPAPSPQPPQPSTGDTENDPIDFLTEATPVLPLRPGSRPATSPGLPHQQLDQQPANRSVRDELIARAFTLPGVVEQPTAISVPGARAMVLGHVCDEIPDAFMVGGEFAHFHPDPDYSAHMTLPENVARAAIDAGWAEWQPSSRVGDLPPTHVMVYAPRDGAELEVVWQLVRTSHAFATRKASSRATV